MREDQRLLARPHTKPPLPPGRHFTVRSVVVGLGVGTVICAANVYFGLQTGWVSIMSMPASLMGFGIFRLLRPHLRFPFTPVENVLLQSVACGMAIMPLGCGFVGVVGHHPPQVKCPWYRLLTLAYRFPPWTTC